MNGQYQTLRPTSSNWLKTTALPEINRESAPWLNSSVDVGAYNYLIIKHLHQQSRRFYLASPLHY